MSALYVFVDGLVVVSPAAVVLLPHSIDGRLRPVHVIHDLQSSFMPRIFLHLEHFCLVPWSVFASGRSFKAPRRISIRQLRRILVQIIKLKLILLRFLVRFLLFLIAYLEYSIAHSKFIILSWTHLINRGPLFILRRFLFVADSSIQLVDCEIAIHLIVLYVICLNYFFKFPQ